MDTELLSRRLPFLALFLALLLLAGCSVHESGSEQGGDKKVDIQTPFGSLKVNTEADAADTGLPVFPGATRKPREGGDSKAANVNISSEMFGVKVAAVEFLSDQTPQKVLDFYKDKLKTYGKVLECQNSDYGPFGRRGSRSSEDDDVTCGKGHGDAVELKVGTKERQHIVAVKPSGKGSEFALVYVETRGKEGSL